MAEENFTLSTYYTNWKQYQEHIKDSVAPLTAEQFALRAAPHLRTVGELAAHIIGCRAGWFTYVLGEDVGDEVKAIANWDESDTRSAAELVQALDATWTMMADRLARWSDDDMRKTFEDEQDGQTVQLSRAWIVWHVMEHDLHHGGELSLTLGMHGIPADFPG
ncbi:MAG TPA: DinB family protein [Ktedonobacterales bacterium]|nr:DinB family protein [Ktedonobacterales bacterium]